MFATPVTGGYVVSLKQIPDTDLIERLKSVNSKINTLFQRGDAVALSLDVKTRSPVRQFEQKLKTNFTRSLTQAGYRVDGSARLKMEVEVEQTDTGRVVEFSKVVGDAELPVGEAEMIPVKELACRVQLVDENGKEILNFSMVYAIPAEAIDLKPFQSIEKALEDWRWSALLERSGKLEFSEKYEEFEIDDVAVAVGPSPARIKEIMKTAEAEKPADAMPNRSETTSSSPGPPPLAPWTARIAAARPLDRSVLEQPLDIGGENSSGAVAEIKVALARIPQVIALCRGPEWYVARSDIAKRKQLSLTPIGEHSELLDFRPDGKVWVSKKGKQSNQLQIWQTVPAEEQVAGDKLLAELDLGDVSDVRKAYFVGRKMLLTLEDDRIVGREMPNGDVVYEKPALLSSVFVTRDRNYFIHLNGSRIALFHAEDGELAGELEGYFAPGVQLYEADVSLDGTRLITKTHNSFGVCGSGIHVWDLESRQKIYELDPRVENNIRWSGNDYLVIADQLYREPFQGPVWRYSGLRDAVNVGGTDHLVVHNNLLSRVKMPSQEVRETIDRHVSESVVGRGDQVAVKVMIVGLRVDKELTPIYKDALERRLKADGFAVDDDAKTKLSFRVMKERSQRDRRKKNTYYRLGKQVSVPETTIEGTLSMGGQLIRKHSAYFSQYSYEVDWDAADPAADLERQFFEKFLEQVASIPLPTVQETLSVGSSTFKEGEETLTLSRQLEASDR